MGEFTTIEYIKLLNQLKSYKNIPKDLITSYSKPIFHSDQQNKYSEPMPWIGIYIALASLICIFAMVADLLHGFKFKKLWFPCKYSTLNAASLSIIAVAIKLPMDLNNSMPGVADQGAKLGSMAFMCTMMANSLPSLVNMDTKELITNTIALGVLVITTVVNVCIQIKTGVISYPEDDHFLHLVSNYKSPYVYVYRNRFIAIIYVVLLLMLLIIHTCSALAVLKSKEILESKYQEHHEYAFQELKNPVGLTVEKLKQHLTNYWIMAETMTPEFMTLCSATSSASGIICASSTILHIIIMLFTFDDLNVQDSDYKWSIPVIFMTQFIGVVIGTIAPLCRCFACLSFKWSIRDQINVFEVENYWTSKLFEWKQSSIPISFPFPLPQCSRKFKVIILNFCIVFQGIVVVACKMIALVLFLPMVCLWFCFHCRRSEVREPEQLSPNQDLSRYALQIQDDMKPAERTLKAVLKSMNHLIREAEKRRPKNFIRLILDQSRGFEGLAKFDSDDVPTLFSRKYVDCWSLVVVTLTTISISLPNIEKKMVDRLVRSVSEGLKYVTLVEESLNIGDEFISTQKAAKMLWLEIEGHHTWLGYKLPYPAQQENTEIPVLMWFMNIAISHIVPEAEVMGIKDTAHEFRRSMSICANSMHHVIKTILLAHQGNAYHEVSQDQLFDYLSSMISDILAACLTNLPQVIAMKCYTSVIEERAADVCAAVQLLGETNQIINILQGRGLPNLDPEDFPFIGKWHTYFRQRPFS